MSGVESKSGKCYSPYYAKSQYTMNEVVQHLFFLYELARRRLVLDKNLDLVATNYKGDTYFGLYVGKKMKRRIVVDLREVYAWQSGSFSGQFSMNTVRHKGYMVLGVFLHLVQDIQAHRANVTYDMVFNNPQNKDVFTNSAKDSKISNKNIKGVSAGDYTVYQELKGRLAKALPMIRLKDYLVDNKFIINCNGKDYSVTDNQAYEDNPYFYRDRYSSAVWFSWAYIDKMMNDTSDDDATIKAYYATDTVPIYLNSCEPL